MQATIDRPNLRTPAIILASVVLSVITLLLIQAGGDDAGSRRISDTGTTVTTGAVVPLVEAPAAEPVVVPETSADAPAPAVASDPEPVTAPDTESEPVAVPTEEPAPAEAPTSPTTVPMTEPAREPSVDPDGTTALAVTADP